MKKATYKGTISQDVKNFDLANINAYDWFSQFPKNVATQKESDLIKKLESVIKSSDAEKSYTFSDDRFIVIATNLIRGVPKEKYDFTISEYLIFYRYLETKYDKNIQGIDSLIEFVNQMIGFSAEGGSMSDEQKSILSETAESIELEALRMCPVFIAEDIDNAMKEDVEEVDMAGVEVLEKPTEKDLIDEIEAEEEEEAIMDALSDENEVVEEKEEPAEVTEFGKLVVENNILSKRNILKLVNEGFMSGFDDPRLLTIRGLKRRGYTPTILKNIVKNSSMNRSDQFFSNDIIRHYLRKELDENATRVFGIVKPKLIEIENFSDHYNDILECKHNNHSKSDEFHTTILTKQIYIDSNDFREIDDPDFYRLAPGKIIRLRYGPFIQYVSHSADKIICRIVTPEKPKKIKGIIHWVSADDKYSSKVKFELYNDVLINGELNKNSIEKFEGYLENYAIEINDSMQLERVGYFKYDRDEDNKRVYIRVVELNDLRV